MSIEIKNFAGEVLKTVEARTLRGANLVGAYLGGAIYGQGVTLVLGPINITGIGEWEVWIFDEYMKIGCNMFPIVKWFDLLDHEIDVLDPEASKYWTKNKTFLRALVDKHRPGWGAVKSEDPKPKKGD